MYPYFLCKKKHIAEMDELQTNNSWVTQDYMTYRSKCIVMVFYNENIIKNKLRI